MARKVALGLVVLTSGLLATVSVEGQQPSCRIAAPRQPVTDLPEASGVAASRASPGVIWSHNDSEEPVIVAVSAAGESLGRTWVAGAAVEDWEDISTGPCPSGSCVYIGDIGDNNARRGSLTVYRVPEPEPGLERSRRAESMRLVYPDGPKDAEAFFLLPDGNLYLVTKGERSAVTLYRAGVFAHGTTARLEPVSTIVEGNRRQGVPRQDRITGADASSDGQWVVVRTLYAIVVYRTSELTAGEVKEVLRYSVADVGERQGEGVAFGDGGIIWLMSEGGGAGRAGTLAKLTCTLP
ncbi:MAG TPA: hypothetical protein VFZ73_18620 [Gemmatimonadaceae bacterium]